MKIDEVRIAKKRFRKDLGDINSLVDSIKSNGLIHPIVVTQNNELISGLRRLEALKRLGIEDVSVHVVDVGMLKLLENGEIDENCVRKNFSIEEITEIDEFLRPVVESAAAQRKRGGKRVLPCANFAQGNDSTGRAREIIARRLGISHTTLEKLRVIKAAAMTAPKLYGEIWTKLNLDKLFIDDCFRKYKRIAERQKILAELNEVRSNISSLEEPAITEVGQQSINGPFTLILGDCVQEAKGIPDNSIDLIFTDPPYAADKLPLFAELAKIAQQKLKPGGSPITYVGHFAIPDVVHLFENGSNLTWWWPMAVIHNGRRDRVHKYRVWVGWKPLLWYVKGDKTNALTDISDTIQSSAPSKIHHEWEQSPTEAEHVISYLTVEGATVFDPFMGYGTTGIAALKKLRKFIGIEIDQEYFALAKNRIERQVLLDREERSS